MMHIVDARTWSLVLNTLWLCVGTCAVSLPPATGLAWLLVRTDLPGRRVAMALLGLLLLVPLYLHAAAWLAGFGLQGWATLAFGLPAWLDGWTGTVWVQVLWAMPWLVLIVGIGFRLVEPELEEQALLDTSAAGVFWRVTLRNVWPAIAAGALWVAVTAAGEITVTDLFAVRTYAEELYTQSAIGPGPEGLVAGAMPGVVLTAALVAAGILLVRRLAPGDHPIGFRRQWVFQLGRWRWPLAALVAAGLLVLVGIPLGNLIYKAGLVVAQSGAARVRTWSPAKCLAIVASSPWRYRREFGWSLSIGALAATWATVAGIALAWFARGGRWRAVLTVALTAAALAVPGPVVGLAMIWLLNRPGCPILLWLYDSAWFAPCTAMGLRGLPLATLVLWHAFGTLPREMLQSAAVDGAGSFRRLCQIAIPCRMSAVAVAWLVALAIALGELSASILVVPPGVTTLSIRIFGLLHYGVEDQVAGICLALIALFACFTALVALWTRAWWRRQAE